MVIKALQGTLATINIQYSLMLYMLYFKIIDIVSQLGRQMFKGML